MKRSILFITAFILLLTGCAKEDDFPIWDFANYDVTFTITDQRGNDLLNPSVEGNILQSNVTVDYRDKNYIIQPEEVFGAETRDNMPRELGLRTCNFEGVNHLTFGEFSPTRNYKNDRFVINWGDGTEDVVGFDLYITWHRGEPTIHKAVYLNDKKISNESFLIEIVKGN